MPNPRAGEKQDERSIQRRRQSQPADGESPVFTQVLTPVFNLFRKSRNRPLIDRLHGEIMAGARQPVFFVEYGVADTLEGRFEILCLVSTIALRAMSALPEPGPGIAQEVTDSLFAHFDVALREIGSQRWQPSVIALRPTIFDRDVTAFRVARSA